VLEPSVLDQVYKGGRAKGGNYEDDFQFQFMVQLAHGYGSDVKTMYMYSLLWTFWLTDANS